MIFCDFLFSANLAWLIKSELWLTEARRSQRKTQPRNSATDNSSRHFFSVFPFQWDKREKSRVFRSLVFRLISRKKSTFERDFSDFRKKIREKSEQKNFKKLETNQVLSGRRVTHFVTGSKTSDARKPKKNNELKKEKKCSIWKLYRIGQLPLIRGRWWLAARSMKWFNLYRSKFKFLSQNFAEKQFRKKQIIEATSQKDFSVNWLRIYCMSNAKCNILQRNLLIFSKTYT